MKDSQIIKNFMLRARELWEEAKTWRGDGDALSELELAAWDIIRQKNEQVSKKKYTSKKEPKMKKIYNPITGMEKWKPRKKK